jgi:GNAT superfamily N-acetyltransferase
VAEGATIREIRRGDGPALAEIWLDRASSTTAIEPETYRHPKEDGLGEWIEWEQIGDVKKGIGTTLVAELDGRVIGMIFVRLEGPMPYSEYQMVSEFDHRVLIIDAIAVRPEHRRTGLGRRLLDAAEDWGRRQGAHYATSIEWARNEQSLPFFRSRGYREQSIRFLKEL